MAEHLVKTLCHIDLQFIEVEILQHIEGGVAASEVVHPALVARFPEAVDFALELLAVFDEGAFGDFYANITSGQAVLPDDSFDDVEGIDLIEIGAGQVDGNREDRHAGIFHRAQTFPDLLDDVGVQFVNELGIFKDRNEHVRRELRKVPQMHHRPQRPDIRRVSCISKTIS